MFFFTKTIFFKFSYGVSEAIASGLFSMIIQRKSDIWNAFSAVLPYWGVSEGETDTVLDGADT